jgi:site-specific DNA-adenine methylase
MVTMNFPGGKGGTYQKYINLMPPHEVYIESHLGGGAIMRYKRRAKRNIGIEIDPEMIEIWTRGNEIDFELIYGDAISFLKSYPFTGKELVYCDPPYLRETRKKYYPLYKYEYSLSQHVKLLEVLKSLPCMVMISGYESPLYIKCLKGWHTYTFQATTHHGMATEWIWMNYSKPTYLHDYRYLGDNFREREKIKLKLKRWIARFKSMPALERQALLSALQAVNENY